MKKSVKKMLVLPVAVVAFVIVAAVISIHLFGGRALKLGIEKVGTDTLKVDVTVEKVSFSVTGGWLKLKGLKVANPEGYEYENLLELGSGEVEMNIKSLLSDKIVIENIKLDTVAVVIEQKEIVHLKKELKNAQIERDILKKAVSIFSRSDGKYFNS